VIDASPAATAVALAVTLGLAAACWGIAAWQMSGMNMGAATRLGPFAFFAGIWASMMAAMMLPSAAPAVVRRVRAIGGVWTAPLFVASYLAVWTLAGLAVYAVYRPHGTALAGVLVIAAGVYELTPLKRHFRRRCHEGSRSGWEFGLYCAGTCGGLMVMLVALGAMSIGWMAVVAVIVFAQKVLPAKTVIDVPLALLIIGLGIWVIIAPMSVPWLMRAM